MTIAMCVCGLSSAQTSSDHLNPTKKADTTVPFDVKATGKKLPVKWGMDTAWDDEYNVNWGIAHYGANFETGRISFQPYALVGDDMGDGKFGLPDSMAYKLQQRINKIKRTGTTKVAINCDHEVLTKKIDKYGNYSGVEDNFGKSNYQSTSSGQKTAAWVKLIKASVQYAQSQGLEVVSVSPFNEPDYGWNQFYNGGPGTSTTNQQNYGMRDFLAIAKALRQDAFFASGAGKNVRICGPNTLNTDRALPWYNYSGMAAAIDEGNTHQLSGSFDNYVDFFKQVTADGKVATADELHNVGEAIVGAEYGMTNGIWWAFDGKARGQFMMDSNEGVKIGYGENRSKWTSAAVYRNDKEGSVHGFIGTSERQANTTNYQFVSKGKDVYFNGVGPTRQWTFEIPGGTGYQKGQINAELVFDITYGDDVAPFQPNGNYQIMSASDRRLITSNGSPNDVTCATQAKSNTQRWHIYPDNEYKKGDCSYWYIDNLGDATQHLNLRNGNLNAGATVLTYNAEHDALEQWYFRYAKNGYFYIITRQSNKYLFNNNGSISVQNAPTSSTSETQLKKYMWRLMPTDATAETTAPSAPTGLTATAQSGSIRLNWNAISEANATYTILRSDAGEWNTIGRAVSGTSFVDNTAQAGKYYTYKIQSVDYSGNRSSASASVMSSIATANNLVMNLDFENSLNDATENVNNASAYNCSFSTTRFKTGSSSLQFNGTDSYAMVPYTVSHNDEMTIAMWVYWNTASNWQRVFDFGNGEDQYMFFTPSNGGAMRFVMKNGGAEEVLDGTSALATRAWKHVAITYASNTATLYVDGQKVSSASFSIKPSDINASICYLGRSMFNADPLFNGNLDDVRIYNYALSAENVRNLYSNEPLTEQKAFEEGEWAWVGENLSSGTFYLLNKNNNVFLGTGSVSADPTVAWTTTYNTTVNFKNGSNNISIQADGKNNSQYSPVASTTSTAAPTNGSINLSVAGSANSGYQFYYGRNWSYWFTTYYNAGFLASTTSAVSAVQVKTNNPTTTDVNTYWLLISQNQVDKKARMTEYKAAFEQASSYTEENLSEELKSELLSTLKANSGTLTYTNIDGYISALEAVNEKCKTYLDNPVEEERDVDMTGLIINPTVIQNGETTDAPEGWTAKEGSITGNGHYTEGTGDTRLEAWHWTSDLNADYYQDITVPNGLYTLTSTTHQRENGNASLYAETYGLFETLMPVGDDNEAETVVENILVTDGTLRIGIKVSGSGNWMTADDFTLTYHGVPTDLSYYARAIVYLNSLADVEMARNIDHTELQQAMDAANSCAPNVASYETAINNYVLAIKNSRLLEELEPVIVERPIEDGQYYLYNIEGGQFLGSGNDWGTQACLGATSSTVADRVPTDCLWNVVMDEDGLYSLSRVGTNNYLFVVNVNAAYVDGASSSASLFKIAKDSETGYITLSINPDNADFGTAKCDITYMGFNSTDPTSVAPLLTGGHDKGGIYWKLMSKDEYDAQKATVNASLAARRDLLTLYQTAVANGIKCPERTVYESVSSTAEQLAAAKTTFAETILAYADVNASPKNPVDLSFLVTNADLNNNTNAGWTAVGGWSSNGSYNRNDEAVISNRFVESWVNGWNGEFLADRSFSQQISNLPQGLYSLAFDAIVTNQNTRVSIEGATLYLSVDDKSATVTCSNSSDSPITFQTPSIYVGARGTATIGFSLEGTNASWVAFDNFRLLYLGDVTVKRVAETIDDALKGDATVDDVDKVVNILLNK